MEAKTGDLQYKANSDIDLRSSTGSKEETLTSRGKDQRYNQELQDPTRVGGPRAVRCVWGLL